MQLSRQLRPGQQAIQFATQIAILVFDSELHTIIDKSGFTNDEARGLARIGLANYFAGRWFWLTRCS
jgi:predicted transcriptional regulator